MPAVPEESTREVEIDFTAYNSEKRAIITVPFGSPDSRVLISATDRGGDLALSITSDVSEDPTQAVTATIEYLETVVELLRADGTSEAAWAAQFDDREYDLQDPEEREI